MKFDGVGVRCSQAEASSCPQAVVSSCPRERPNLFLWEPSAPPIRTGRIQSEALGAPTAISPRPGPVAARVPTQPMAQTIRVASTGTPGWNAQGGTTITVAPNDSLNQMSTRFGVPASAILSANGLTSAGQVTPGRQLIIPVYSASGMNPAAAPMTARAVPAAPSERIKAAERELLVDTVAQLSRG